MRYVSARGISRWFSIAVTTLTVSACGGGGGGNGGGGSPPATGPSLSLSTQSMTFTARAPGVDAPAQNVTATVTDAAQITGTLYFVVTIEGPAVRTVGNIVVNSQSTGTATVTPQLSSTLGPGTHTSTIRVAACVGSATCASGHLRNSPQTINVTYTVDQFRSRHKLLASDSGVAFTSLPSLAKLTRTLQVRDSQGHAIPWSASSDQSWLNVTATGITSTLR